MEYQIIGRCGEKIDTVPLHELLMHVLYSSGKKVIKLRPGDNTFCFFRKGYKYTSANVRCADSQDKS